MFISNDTICTQETQKDGTIQLRFYDTQKKILFEKNYKTWKAANIAQTRLFTKYFWLRENKAKEINQIKRTEA